DILFSGTVTQVGFTTNFPNNEKLCDDPITIYDINKLAAEKYLQYYSRQMGGRSVTLRLSNVYGPGPQSGSADRGFLNMMTHRAIKGEPLTIYGKGQFVRDYIFIDDVVNAFLIAGSKMDVVKGRYYVLGSGKGHTIKQAAEMVKERVLNLIENNVEIRYIPVPEGLSKIETRQFVADASNFKRDTGWEPSVSLQTGIDRTIKFFSVGNNA
ncbi:MAG: NAD-dependent epimerase/dehydratase family protein, partial [Nitrospinales bacterium]